MLRGKICKVEVPENFDFNGMGKKKVEYNNSPPLYCLPSLPV